MNDKYIVATFSTITGWYHTKTGVSRKEPVFVRELCERQGD